MHCGKYPDDAPAVNCTVRRRSAAGPIYVPAPPLLHDYNHYMGGVDLADNIPKHYSIGRKTFRAYRRLVKNSPSEFTPLFSQVKLQNNTYMCINHKYIITNLPQR